MKLAPGIFQYEFPEKISSEIIKQSQHIDEWKQSKINYDKSGVRTSSEVSFSECFSRGVVYATHKEIEKRLHHYTDIHKISEVSMNDKISLLRYDLGQCFDTHYDSSYELYRVVSMLVYLNPNDYLGGETYFPEFDINIKPEKPSIVFFPSNYVYTHQAKPVVEGQKFVLVGWMNDEKTTNI